MGHTTLLEAKQINAIALASFLETAFSEFTIFENKTRGILYAGAAPIEQLALHGKKPGNNAEIDSAYHFCGHRISKEPLDPLLDSVVGTLSFESIQYKESINHHYEKDDVFPDIHLLRYRHQIIFRCSEQRLLISSQLQNGSDSNEPALDRLHNQITQACLNKNPLKHRAAPITEVTDKTSDQRYLKRVHHIQKRIQSGDAYQVVPSEVTQFQSEESASNLYAKVYEKISAPYYFLHTTPNYILIGASPETMISIEDGQIRSKPIAGTIKRTNQISTHDAAGKLKNDIKERSEHAMLVDLARNDIGKVCEIGSVEIESLMEPIDYGNITHLVSTVKGQLKENHSRLDALLENAPAGTLSGAPKLKAIEIIQDIETHRRNFYGGTLFIQDHSGDLDSCILIRTIIKQGKRLHLQSGGGVVKGSVPQKELKERKDKLNALCNIIKGVSG